MKRIAFLLLCLVVMIGMVFAGGNNQRNQNRIIAGVTLFQPMNFQISLMTAIGQIYFSVIRKLMGLSINFHEISRLLSSPPSDANINFKIPIITTHEMK